MKKLSVRGWREKVEVVYLNKDWEVMLGKVIAFVLYIACWNKILTGKMVELKLIKGRGREPFLWFTWDMLPQEGKSSKCSCGMELLWSVVTLEGKYSCSSKWLVHSPNIYILSRQMHSDARTAISSSLYIISSNFLSSLCCLLSEQVSLCPSPFLSEKQANIRETYPLEWPDCNILPFLFAQRSVAEK